MYRVEITGATAIQDEALARRRRLEEERKARIFHPKIRTIGIDVNALNEQLRIKEDTLLNERNRERAFVHNVRETVRILDMMDEKVTQDRRTIAQQLNEFRLGEQKRHTRRDFDLYDPEALRKDRPARVGDGDERCGPASMQKFEGEDLMNKDRIEEQKRQLQVWTAEQMAEHEARRRAEEEEKYLEALHQSEINQHRKQLEDSEWQARSAIIRETQDLNSKLAEEKRARDEDNRQKETMQNLQEIQDQIESAFLTESPSQATSVYGSHRLRQDFYKGMSPQERLAIFEEQERQRIENQRKMEAERQDRQNWDLLQQAINRAATKAEREKAREKRALAERLRAENEKMSQEFRELQKTLNTKLTTNVPSHDYHAQFNTSSR